MKLNEKTPASMVSTPNLREERMKSRDSQRGYTGGAEASLDHHENSDCDVT